MVNLKLKARIVEKFGSQWQFARHLNSHEAVISRVIRGHWNLSEAERDKWAKALESEPEILFGDQRGL